jgi:hypothetical protein
MCAIPNAHVTDEKFVPAFCRKEVKEIENYKFKRKLEDSVDMEFHNAEVVNQIHLSITCPLGSSCKPSFSTTFGHFLTRCVHVSLSRRSLLHDVGEFVSYKLNLLCPLDIIYP